MNELRRGAELFYDPAIFTAADNENEERTFAAPAARARGALVKELGEGKETEGQANEEAILNENGIDFILVGVFEPKFAAFSEALRRYQFTDNEDCEHLDERTRTRKVGLSAWDARVQSVSKM